MKYVSRVTPLSLKSATLTPIYEVPVREFMIEISDRRKEWYESWAKKVLIDEYLHKFGPSNERFTFTNLAHVQISNMVFPGAKLILAYRVDKSGLWELSYVEDGIINHVSISAERFREWANDSSNPLHFVGITRPTILRS